MNAKLTYRPAVGSMAHGVIEDESGTIIASILDTDQTGQIMAAAPDFLEALEAQESAEEFIKNGDSEDPFYTATYHEMLSFARALRKSAIAKATISRV